MKRFLSMVLIMALLLTCGPVLPVWAASEGPLDGMIRWALSSDGTLTISSLWGGEMPDYASAESAPWAGRCDEIRQVVIKDSIYSIGSYAFAGCKNLTAITVADSVKSIGRYAFSGCISLAEINVPEGITAIYEGTFSDCGSLAAITIPEGVSSIAYGAFNGCDSLRNVFYPGTEARKGYISIGDHNDALTDALWHFEVTELSETMYLCGQCGLKYYKDGAAAPVKKLTVVTLPEQLNYLVGDDLCLEGLWLQASYEDGTSVYITDAELEAVSVNMGIAGKNTVELWLGGASAEITIAVHDADVTTLDAATYPESDHDYANSINESKTFTYPGAVSLAITFSSQTCVEKGYDYIYVYDGNGNELASYTGTEAAGKTLTVPGDTFEVKLTSDVGVTAYGYSFARIVACNSLIHIPVTDPATVTCTQAGLTEGSHCGVCDLVLVEQKKVEALGHDFEAAFYWQGHTACNLMLSCNRSCGLQTTLECRLEVTESEPGVDIYTAIAEYEGQKFTDEYVHDFRCTVVGAIISSTLGESYERSYVKLLKDGVEIAGMEALDALYQFDQLPPGDYTLVITRKNYAPKTVNITLTEGTLIQPIELFVLGDVTADGKINIADAAKIYGYIKQDFSLEDVDSACDITGDGKLTIVDVVKVYAHVKGTNPLF